MDWGVAAEWEDEALASYPTLPKSFTNAKTAKKRKHKELFVTDEDLLKPVRLAKQTATARGDVRGGGGGGGGALGALLCGVGR